VVTPGRREQLAEGIFYPNAPGCSFQLLKAEVDSTEHTQVPERISSWQPIVQPGRAAESPAWLRVRWLAIVLGAAWLVPALLHALRLDVITPFLLLLTVASVLRSGSNLVDRFMLAAALLAGAVMALGLVFSLWPWGLRPVQVAGTLLSLTGAAAWFARRRPSLPRRMLGSDVVVIGSGLAAFLAAYAPVAKLPAARRFIFSATAEDRYAHFALFDTIHRLGGYTFVHQRQAAVAVAHPAEIVYPSGSHFLYALFDTFLRSSADPGPPVAEFNRYFVYVLLAYAFLIMSLVWAARWIAGPLVTRWRRVFLCSLVAALAIGGPFVLMIEAGFDSEIAGLAFLALAVAVSARPPRVAREHVLIGCALLVAVAYSYNLYAPMAAAALLAAAVAYRRRLRGHWAFAAVCAILACAVASLQAGLSLVSGFNAQAQALAGGVGVLASRSLVLLLALLIVASMASAAARRLPAGRVVIAQVAIAAVVVALFGVYQVLNKGRTSYYYDKLLMAEYIVCLTGLGSAAIALRRLPAPSVPRGPLRLVTDVPLAIVAALLAVGIVAASQWGMHSPGGGPAAWRRTPIAVWNAGEVKAPTSASMIALADAHLLGDRVPSLVLYSNWGLGNWRDSFLVAVFNRDLGEMKQTINKILTVRAGGPPINAATTSRGLSGVLAALRTSPFPLRIIVGNALFARELHAMLAAHPSVRASVFMLPTLRS
jgi:hypothetical protein